MRPDKSVQRICNVRKQNCFHDWKSTLNMIGNVMCIKKIWNILLFLENNKMMSSN